MARRRQIRQSFDPVLTIDARQTNVTRLVYILVANRPIRYGRDYSRIVYVGTTEQGIRRIAGSASRRVTQALEQLHGIKRLDAFVIWTSPKTGPQTKRGRKVWYVLERALLLAFKEKYGTQPKLNVQGKRMKEGQEFEVFSREAVERFIKRYA